jgi:type IV pilus assembly protein PilA
MFSAIKKHRDKRSEGDEGFTLIELLVVIIIIGILAAIAIPVFLNQRQKGWDSAVQADLRNAATAQETVFTETSAYTTDEAALEGAGFKFSGEGNYTGAPAIDFAGTTGDVYCMAADSRSTKTWSIGSQGTIAEGATAGCS